MESSGRLIILLVAGVIVAFAAIAIRNYMENEPAAPIAAEISKRVIVAKRDVPPGTIVLIGTDIDWAELPPELAAKEAPKPATEEEGEKPAAEKEVTKEPEYMREGSVRLEEFNGAVARRMLRAGDPVPPGALTRAGEGGFMSAVLEPGMRAVSIAVNATSGNAGFVSPGDRVDLIVTHHVKQGASGTDAIVSDTFVYDVRVLAVDQMVDNPDNKAILAKTVTVEVSPHQAEQVAVASELGHISVALRSLGTPEKKAEEAPAADAQVAGEGNPIVDLYGDNSRANPDYERKLSPRIRVIRGDQTESVEFF